MCLRTRASRCYTRRSACMLVPHKMCRYARILRANLVQYSRESLVEDLVENLVGDLVHNTRKSSCVILLLYHKNLVVSTRKSSS